MGGSAARNNNTLFFFQYCTTRIGLGGYGRSCPRRSKPVSDTRNKVLCSTTTGRVRPRQETSSRLTHSSPCVSTKPNTIQYKYSTTRLLFFSDSVSMNEQGKKKPLDWLSFSPCVAFLVWRGVSVSPFQFFHSSPHARPTTRTQGAIVKCKWPACLPFAPRLDGFQALPRRKGPEWRGGREGF